MSPIATRLSILLLTLLTASVTPATHAADTLASNPDVAFGKRSGEGVNAIPTGKPFYVVLRAYVPVKGADLTAKAVNLSTTSEAR